MNSQEAFNKVWERAKKLVKSQHRGVNAFGDVVIFCCYRNPIDGNKCFVGELIPDELYKPSMERNSVASLQADYHEIEELFKDVKQNLLGDLQSIHDGDSVSDWEEKLRWFGLYYKLEIPE